MSIINYKDPIIVSWNVDNEGKEVSVSVPNEPIRIIQGKAALNGIPDEQYRVIIDNYVEVNIRDRLLESNQYKVDYTHAFIFFHESVGDIALYASYYSRGIWRIPASKVWTKLSVNGEVIETMDGAFATLDSQSTAIQALKSVRISEGTTEPTNTKYWYDPNDNSRVVRT